MVPCVEYPVKAGIANKPDDYLWSSHIPKSKTETRQPKGDRPPVSDGKV